MAYAADAISRIVSGPALKIDAPRCLKGCGVECDACEAACPLALSSIHANLIEGLSPDGCTGCGACESLCPVGCLDANSGEYAWLADELARHAAGGADGATISCTLAEEEGTIRVRCLRSVDLPMVLHAWASGLHTVRLVVTRCEECESSAGAMCFQELVGNAGIWAEYLDPRGRLSLTTVSGAQASENVRDPELRRAFGLLTGATRRVLRAASQSERRIPLHVSPHRHLAVEALEALLPSARPDADLPPGVGALCREAPSVDSDRCSGCGECAAHCPTHALRTSVRDDRWRLTLSPRRCVGCGACIGLCRFDAIRMVDMGTRSYAPKRKRLIDREMATCARCGESFGRRGGGSANDLCAACDNTSSRFTDFY